MSRFRMAYTAGALTLLFFPEIGATQTRSVALPPNAEVISRLDVEASHGFLPVIADRPFSVERKLPDPIAVYGGRRRIVVGSSQQTSEAAPEDRLKPVAPGMMGRNISEGVLYRKNFALRNDSGYSLSVALARPSFPEFPLYLELEPRQEFVADLAVGVYYIAVESAAGKLYFRVDVSARPSTDLLDAFVYNIITDSAAGYTQVPAFQVTRERP
jgi:hypothetical protein